MTTTLDNTLVLAISSRVLFDLSESHKVFTDDGIDAYSRYQIAHENEILAPGVAFNMVRKFLALNEQDSSSQAQHVEVVLISRNTADTGLRIFNSIEHYGLNISRAAFTGGESPYQYIDPFRADLFLSTDSNDVSRALMAGHAAASILPSRVQSRDDGLLKIAFDGDAVLFSDEAEQIFREQGMHAFAESEKRTANQPLSGGPLRKFLASLHRLQQNHPKSPIRTALITARAAPAHERVVRTLRDWNIRIDECYFLGGMDKGEFLNTFGADIFFDDQHRHCESARQYVATGHVPNNITTLKTG